MSPEEILKKYWGYTSFKKPQKEIIKTVLAKENALVVLPTGGGKSLCYQIPGLILDGVCLVISPLIALMHDQINNLALKNIKAIVITSNLNQEEIIVAFDNLQFGNYKFLYLSPEKLQSPFILQKIAQLNINSIAIDEAHCISEWGHDFRPAYLKIPILETLEMKVPIIALTATATPRVVKDIVKNLSIENVKIFSKSLVRSHLAYKVIVGENVQQHLLEILNKDKEPAIIYVNSRKKTKDICTVLNQQHISGSYYHGGLSQEDKKASFLNWMQEKTRVIVATNAFGMGIDKNNVKTIVHLDIPQSLEHYMQEAGRAGRNHKTATSYIISNAHAISKVRAQFLKNSISVSDAKSVYKSLCNYFHVAFGELDERLFEFDINSFSLYCNMNTSKTISAVKLLERENILAIHDNYSRKSTFKFIASPNTVLKYSDKNHTELIRLLLRSHGGLFEHAIAINEQRLSKKLGYTIKEVQDQLNKLETDGISIYHAAMQQAHIQFLVPREDDRTIHTIATRIEKQRSVKLEKIDAMLKYVQNTTVCRSILLVSYFDEDQKVACGICDVCLSKNTPKVGLDQNKISDQILELLTANNQMTILELEKKTGLDKASILLVSRYLLDTDKINLTSQNKLEKTSND